ncbi:MAG: hypothetical protein A2W03_06865 [Candidatus Aminicenantes bacterium RBG_16_63_16]|nr:MAG: hypothetical protein A2W03_06865 [Candidatus Aminicenantes bacterium RBG_16_63_16]
MKSAIGRIGLAPFLLGGFISGISFLNLSPPHEKALQERTLTIGYSSRAFSKGIVNEARVAIDGLANALSARTSARFAKASTAIFDDMSTLRNALLRKELDIVGLVTLGFIEIADSIPMVPFFIATQADRPYFELAIIVRVQDSVQDLKGLRGKKLAVDTAINELIGTLWLDVLLLETALPERSSFFSELINSEKAGQSVLKVFFGQADACLTTQRAFETMTELNPQVGKKLRVLRKSPLLLAGVVCVRDDMSAEDRTAILDTLGNLQNEPEGGQLLMIMQIDRLLPFKPEYLQTTSDLLKKYKGLRAARENGGQRTRRSP